MKGRVKSKLCWFDWLPCGRVERKGSSSWDGGEEQSTLWVARGGRPTVGAGVLDREWSGGPFPSRGPKQVIISAESGK